MPTNRKVVMGFSEPPTDFVDFLSSRSTVTPTTKTTPVVENKAAEMGDQASDPYEMEA